MNPTIISLELKRLARDYVGLFFICLLYTSDAADDWSIV